MKAVGRNKIEQQSRRINLLLFLFTIGILAVVILWTARSLFTETASKYSLHYAASAVAHLNEHLEHEIVLLQSAAKSKRIIEWFEDENHPEKKQGAYDDITNYASLLYSKNLYFVIAKSLGEYSIDDGAAFEQLKPYASVSPDVFKDKWFFECMKSSAPYVLNTDIDKRDGRHRVWINKKLVNAKGEPVGVIASGSWFSEKMNEQFDHFARIGARSFVLNANGVIQMDSSLAGKKRFLIDDLEHNRANSLNIQEFIKEEKLLQTIRKFQLKESIYKDDNEPQTIYTDYKVEGSDYHIAVVTPVRCTDWMVITLFSRHAWGSLSLYYYLFLSTLLFSVFYFLASISINRRLIFLPLHHLTASVEETKLNTDMELYGIRRDDEIGFLAQQIYTMREQFITYNSYLARAKEDAEAGNKAKNQFMLMVSHELRTPMNAILGMIYILKQKELTAEQSDLIGITEQSSQQLLHIINNVIYFSDIETGYLSLNEEKFALRQVIRNAVEEIRDEADKKGLPIETNIDADIPEWIIGDAPRFAKILSELLSNAVKFTISGSVSLSVCVYNSSQNTDGAADVMMLLFAVKDTGIGILPEELEHIFAPFIQSDGSVARKYGGIGIGLTICKRLALLLGGDLRCESTQGIGSTFYWTAAVKVAADEPGGISSILQSSTANHENYTALVHGLKKRTGHDTAPLTVLIAEDNRINQIVLTQMLTERGWMADTADNGKLAVEMLERKDYDIVLMDIQMPVMDGIEAAERIKRNPKYADLPIIAVTANMQTTDVRRYIVAGIAYVVAKPVDPKELIAKIVELCDLREYKSSGVKPKSGVTLRRGGGR